MSTKFTPRIRSALSKEDQELWDKYTALYSSAPIIVKSPSYTTVATLPRSLDLHGFTLQAAHQKFIEFLETHHKFGTKSITVITGRRGNIKNELPNWCKLTNMTTNCAPILNSHGTFSSYQITLKKN